jgi:hypothetical protein
MNAAKRKPDPAWSKWYTTTGEDRIGEVIASEREVAISLAEGITIRYIERLEADLAQAHANIDQLLAEAKCDGR